MRQNPSKFFDFTFLVMLVLIGFLHLLTLYFSWKHAEPVQNARVLKVRSLKTLGLKESKTRNSVHLSKSESPQAKKITKKTYQKKTSQKENSIATGKKSQNYQSEDFNLQQQGLKKTPTLQSNQYAGSELLKYFQSQYSSDLLSQDMVKSLSTSDFSVHAEVPEGVELDELNNFEFVFYSFQKRLAMQYFNSFFSQLREFELRNPHRRFPMTREAQQLTARITFGRDGTLEEIEVINASNVHELQDFFIEVMDKIKAISNPPEALLGPDQKLRVYYGLKIL